MLHTVLIMSDLHMFTFISHLSSVIFCIHRQSWEEINTGGQIRYALLHGVKFVATWSTLALKPREDVDRCPKQGCQKGLMSSKNFKKDKKKKSSQYDAYRLPTVSHCMYPRSQVRGRELGNDPSEVPWTGERVGTYLLDLVPKTLNVQRDLAPEITSP